MTPAERSALFQRIQDMAVEAIQGMKSMSSSQGRAERPSSSQEGSDLLEAVVRPIVEGQLRSFCHDHPECAEAVNWYRPRPDKQQTFVNSVAKRIVRDLLCADTRMRLIAALGGTASAGGAKEGSGTTICAPRRPGWQLLLPRSFRHAMTPQVDWADSREDQS